MIITITSCCSNWILCFRLKALFSTTFFNRTSVWIVNACGFCSLLCLCTAPYFLKPFAVGTHPQCGLCLLIPLETTWLRARCRYMTLFRSSQLLQPFMSRMTCIRKGVIVIGLWLPHIFHCNYYPFLVCNIYVLQWWLYHKSMGWRSWWWIRLVVSVNYLRASILNCTANNTCLSSTWSTVISVHCIVPLSYFILI